MKTRVLFTGILFLLLSASTAYAQIGKAGVASAASYNGPIAPGSIAAAFTDPNLHVAARDRFISGA